MSGSVPDSADPSILLLSAPWIIQCPETDFTRIGKPADARLRRRPSTLRAFQPISTNNSSTFPTPFLPLDQVNESSIFGKI